MEAETILVSVIVAMELLLAFVAGLALAAVIAFLLLRRPPAPAAHDPAVAESLKRLQTDFGALLESVRRLPPREVIEGLKERVTGIENRVPEDLAGSVRRLQDSFTKVEAEIRARKTLEEKSQAAIERIEAVVAGAQSRGAAGEVVLAEAFAQFPAEMGDTQFRVNGKPVEFALVLPNKKRMPIDSKWPAVKDLEQYAAAVDPAAKQELLARIEKAVLKKVEEVTKYIDAASTTLVAVAAVPDAAYFACRTAHIQAYRQRVLLMPYSLTVPFLLALYNLHLQFARSIDQENLEGYLSQMETQLNEFDNCLENSVQRGATMVLNAYTDMHQLVGEMRSALAILRRLPVDSLAEGQESLLKR